MQWRADWLERLPDGWEDDRKNPCGVFDWEDEGTGSLECANAVAAVAAVAPTSPAMVQGRSKLMTLAAELHCAISKASDNETVLSLRLTCRKLSAACLDTICSRFFDHRRALHTLAGLQQLVEITSTATSLLQAQDRSNHICGLRLPYEMAGYMEVRAFMNFMEARG